MLLLDSKMLHGFEDIDSVMFNSSHFSFQGSIGGVFHTQTTPSANLLPDGVGGAAYLRGVIVSV